MKRWILGLALIVVAATALQAAVKNYAPAASGNHVTFHAHSTGHDFQGRTPTVTGGFGCDRARIAETAFGEFQIPVKSLKTGIGARDREMYSVFEAEKYPSIAFRLKSLKDLRQVGTDTYTARAAGTLSIHGVSREVELAVTAVFAGEKLVVDGTAALKMTEYGMEPPHFLMFRVADNVRISFRVDGRARAGA